MTLKEARRRTGLDLVSDAWLPYYSPVTGSGMTREGQRTMERKYGRHGIIRRGAIGYFSGRGYELYRRGITVNGAGTCPDFAIFKRNKIILIEWLTQHSVLADIIRKKLRVQRYAPIQFVVEDKPQTHFQSSRDYIRYHNRVRRLARICVVYWCNLSTKALRRARF